MIVKHKTNIAIFASGNGSNFEAIARACAENCLNAWGIYIFVFFSLKTRKRNVSLQNRLKCSK